MEAEFFIMRQPDFDPPDFDRRTLLALFLPSVICLVVSGVLFWWGMR